MHDTYTHKHRHTHTNQYAYAPADVYPHTHIDDASRDDSHAHWHRTDEPHVHLGDALGLPEYWRRRVRWWFVQKLDNRTSRGYCLSLLRRWWARLANLLGSSIGRHRRGGYLHVGESHIVSMVSCPVCRSMGMMGMVMMFGIPVSCPACAVQPAKRVSIQ